MTRIPIIDAVKFLTYPVTEEDLNCGDVLMYAANSTSQLI